MKFSVLKEQFKEYLDINHLSDIARELGVSPQAVSNWKSRDSVPYKYVIKIREKINEIKNTHNTMPNISDKNTLNLGPENSIYQINDKDDISLIELFSVLARQIKIIILTPFVLCTITIINLLFFVDPTYESHAKIMSSNGGQSQAVGIAAQFGISLPVNQSEVVVKSRTLAKSMLLRKFDTFKYGKNKSLLQILTYGDGRPDVGLDTLLKAGINSVIGMIDISQNGSFYDLTISAFEPAFARSFAVALIEELDNHQSDYNRTKTSKARKFIEERIVYARNDLENAEETLKDFNDRNRRIENSPSLQLDRQRLLREVSVLTGVFTTLKQQLETTKIEEVKDSEYVIILDHPEAPIFPSKPRKKQIVILVGLSGLGVGIIFAFIKEFIEKILKSNQEGFLKINSILIKNLFDLLPKRFKK